MSKELIELNKRMKKQIIAGEDSEITKLREQVAAQAAVIEKLREALQAELDYQFDNYKEVAPWIKKALSTPTDSTQILAEVRRAERERCAVVAWNHYMDQCKKSGISPTVFEGWCSAAAIRAME